MLAMMSPTWAYNSKFVASCEAFHDSLNNLDRKIEATKLTDGSITLLGAEEGSANEAIPLNNLADLYKLHDQVYAKYALLMGVRNLILEYENLTAALNVKIKNDEALAKSSQKFFDRRNLINKITSKRKNTLNVATMDTILRYVYLQYRPTPDPDNPDAVKKFSGQPVSTKSFKEWIKIQAETTKLKITQSIASEEDDQSRQKNIDPLKICRDTESELDSELRPQCLFIIVNNVIEKNQGEDTIENFFMLHLKATQNEDAAQSQARVEEYRRLLNRVVNNTNMNDFLNILGMEETLSNLGEAGPNYSNYDDEKPGNIPVQLDNQGIHKLTINYGKALNEQLNQIGSWNKGKIEKTAAQDNDPQEEGWSFKNSIFYQDLWEDIKDELALNKGNPSLANDLNDTLTAAVAGHYMKHRTAMQGNSKKYLTTLVDDAVDGQGPKKGMEGSLLEKGVINDIAMLLNQAGRTSRDNSFFTTDLVRACNGKAPFLNEHCVNALDTLIKHWNTNPQSQFSFQHGLNNSLAALRAQLMQIKGMIDNVEKLPSIRHLEYLHQKISNFALYNCERGKFSNKSCYMGGISSVDGTVVRLLHLGDNLMGTFELDNKSSNYTRDKFNLFCKELSKEDKELVKPACQQSKMFTTFDKYYNAHSWFSFNRGYYIDRDPITGKIYNIEKRPTAWSFLPKALANSLNDPLWAQFMQGYIWSPTMIDAARQVGFMQKEFNAQNEAVNTYVTNLWENAAENAANYQSYLYNQYTMGAVSPNQVFSTYGQLTPEVITTTGVWLVLTKQNTQLTAFLAEKSKQFNF